jgi:hypothetical protein
MLRSVIAITALLASIGSASAQSGPIAIKYRFEIAEPGSFFQKTLKEMGTKEAAALITAACAAFEVDCSQEAVAATQVVKTINVGDQASGEEHHGIIRAPVGYEICKARIDTAHASVDSQTSFSGEIIRDAHENGLGFYAEVPKNRPQGHSAEADLYLEFVPAGTLSKYGCWPTSNHSDADHLWIWDHGNLAKLQSPARYP